MPGPTTNGERSPIKGSAPPVLRTVSNRTTFGIDCAHQKKTSITSSRTINERDPKTNLTRVKWRKFFDPSVSTDTTPTADPNLNPNLTHAGSAQKKKNCNAKSTCVCASGSCQSGFPPAQWKQLRAQELGGMKKTFTLSRGVQHGLNPLTCLFPDIIGPNPPCKYRIRRIIARGTYSTVWTLQNNETNDIVVGKLSDLTQMWESTRLCTRAEAENIRACQHPNIIKLYDTFERNDNLLHILEYASAGDLLTQINVRRRYIANEHSLGYFQEREAFFIFIQLCLAIKYLHDRHIMHRDLKTSNVMVMRSGLIKLGDFGFSRQYQESASTDVGTTFCGTPYYLAPELWRSQPYSYKADIWSLGVIFYEILTFQKPFFSDNISELMDSILCQGSFAPIPSSRCGKELQALVNRMLIVDDTQRPSIKDILFTPIIQKHGLELLKNNIQRLENVDSSTISAMVDYIGTLQEEYAAHCNKAATFQKEKVRK